jgi:hypothetical protein
MASPIECARDLVSEAVQLGASRLADLLEAFSDVFKLAARLGLGATEAEKVSAGRGLLSARSRWFASRTAESNSRSHLSDGRNHPPPSP